MNAQQAKLATIEDLEEKERRAKKAFLCCLAFDRMAKGDELTATMARDYIDAVEETLQACKALLESE